MRPINEVPIKITAVAKRESRISQQQVALIIGPYAVYLVFLLFVFRIADNVEDEYTAIGMWTLAVIVLFITTRIVMRWGLDEKKLYQDFIKEKCVDIRRCWGILDIAEDGKVLYTNGHSAYVVKMERSNTIGRPKDFEEQHFLSVTTIIRQLINSNYIIKKYSVATTDDNSESFSWLDKNRTTLTNLKLKAMIGDILKYSKSLSTKGRNRYVEYWVIYAKESKKDQLGEITKIMYDMKASIYKPEILKSDEIYQFLRDFYKLRYINFKSCFYHNVPNQQVLHVIKDNIRYKHEARGTFDPVDARADVAAQKYKERLQLLNKTNTK